MGTVRRRTTFGCISGLPRTGCTCLIALLAAMLVPGLAMPPAAAAAAGSVNDIKVATSQHRLTCHQPSRSGYAFCSVVFSVNLRTGDPKEPNAYVHCRLLYAVRYTDNPKIVYRKTRELANSVYLSNGQGSTEFLIRVKGDPRHGPVKAALVDDIQCTAHR